MLRYQKENWSAEANGMKIQIWFRKNRNTSAKIYFIGQSYNAAQNALENVESPTDDEQTE